MNNGQCTMDKFTREELEEIRKWAEVIGYQGTARDLEGALALNRGIVGKCEVGLGRGVPEKSYMEDATREDT